MEPYYGEVSYRQKACQQERSRNEATCARDPSVRPGSYRHAILVLIAAGIMVLCGKGIVHKMLHKTRNINWETPRDSPSRIAEEQAQKFFPSRMRGAIVMAVEALPGTTSVLTDTVADFSRNVSNSLKQDKRVSVFEPIVFGYYLDVLKHHPPKDFMEKELVSADKKMTLILIQPTKLSGNWDDANAWLQGYCGSPPTGYTLHITGMPAVLHGDGCSAGVHEKVNTRDMNFEVLATAEMFTLPITMLIMARIVKNVRLLICALITVTVSFVASCLVMIPWMDLVGIPSDAPAAMGSVIMAGSLDYTLFLLARFSEQHTEGWPLQSNVDTIKRYTGRTITVSGLLVAIAFFGSVLMPERNMQGSGFALGVSVLVTVATNVTLIPALLLVAGKVLTGSSSAAGDGASVELHGYIQFGDSDELSGPTRHLQKGNSFWLTQMRMMSQSPVAALGTVLLLMMPILYHLPSLNITADRFALLPMGMPAVTAMRRVQDNFPVGILDPFAIVITSPLQGAKVHLNKELRDGVSGLGKHDLKAMGSKLRLNALETAAIENAVKQVKNGHDLEHAKVDASVLASVGAGAAVAADKARGASDGDSLRAAVRAAHKTGAKNEDILHAVAASAAWLRAEGKPVSAEAVAAVKKEALKIGLTEADASKLAEAVEQGAHQQGAQDGDVHHAHVAAAKAGAAVGTGQLQGHDGVDILKDALHALKGSDLTTADVAEVLQAVVKVTNKGKDDANFGIAKLKENAQNPSERKHVKEAVVAALVAVMKTSEAKEALGKLKAGEEAAGKTKGGHQILSKVSSPPKDSDVAKGVKDAGSDVSKMEKDLDKAFDKQWPLILDVLDAVTMMTEKEHGMLLLPSGFAAMLDLCHAVKNVGQVHSMLGPTWAYHQSVDWASSIALNTDSSFRQVYRPFLDSHVNGNRALLEVHTTFPTIGAGGGNFVMAVREALAAWESRHPGYKAVLAGGAAEAADTQATIMRGMWTYLAVSVSIIMGVVYMSFQSIMVPLRLAAALFFTMAATFGAGVIVYQTPLLHGLFPGLRYYDGISHEVVPLVSGVGIALGLDYDIFLVSRIVEFRLQRFSDRASIFRGVMKTGSVISGAGLIMSLAFSGLLFSNKVFFQQFGVLLISSVMFDTFVVRTVLVPALMLIAQDWNWWPREMPPGIHDVLEGEVESCGGHSRAMMGDMALGNVVTTKSMMDTPDEWSSNSGFIA